MSGLWVMLRGGLRIGLRREGKWKGFASGFGSGDFFFPLFSSSFFNIFCVSFIDDTHDTQTYVRVGHLCACEGKLFLCYHLFYPLFFPDFAIEWRRYLIPTRRLLPFLGRSYGNGIERKKI